MRRACLLMGLFSSAVPGLARAGGVSLPIRGVRALSVAGAHVAGAEEINALWYNPSRIDGSVITLEVGTVALDASFTPPDGSAVVENTASPLPNPTFGVVWRMNDMISVGLGAYAPYAGQHRFDETGPQRYALVSSHETTLLFLNAGVAFRLNKFRLGAGLQNVVSHVRQRTVISGYTGLFGEPTDPELDILNEVDLHDPFTLTGNIGASFDAGPFTFGATVQLPYKVSGRADFRVRLGESVFFDPVEIEGNQVDLEIPFPVAIRGGARWQIVPRWSLEAAVNYENWSVQEELRLDPGGDIQLHGVPGIGDYDMRAIVIDRRMRDTVSLHLGSDVEIFEGFHLRNGVFHEPSAFDDATFSVAQLDDDKVGLAIGASYRVGSFRFDAALSRIFQGTREVTNSEVRQLNPTNPDQAVVVGNGTYRSGFWAGGAGVTWLLD